MRNCSKMLIKAGDKIRDWKELANADSNTRRQARFDMQHKANEAMAEQTGTKTESPQDSTRNEPGARTAEVDHAVH